MYFDGGCTVNPGGIASFGVLIEKEGERVFTMRGVMDEEDTSSNVAEYGAFITGLTWFLKENLQDEKILVHGDSKLVISQMFRHWRIKNGAYVKYALHAQKLVSQFSDMRGRLIPRHLNREADALASFYSTERIRIPSVS